MILAFRGNLEILDQIEFDCGIYIINCYPIQLKNIVIVCMEAIEFISPHPYLCSNSFS